MDRESQSIALEKRHVHSVYDKIAPHFSDTRYKAWPRVKEFILNLEPGSLVADVGCGNGKYLGINNQIYKIGCDCCVQLVDIARSRRHEVMVCDNIRLPYRNNSFDAVISIAVIHHFATTERRAHALRELARICRPGGQVMIYVWALEQKQRKFDSQDVLVPWHLQPIFRKNEVRNKCEQDLPSSGSTSDDDLKKISAVSSQNKSISSQYYSFPKGTNNSGTTFPFPIPTTDYISHSPDCPSSKGQNPRDGPVYRIQSDSRYDEISSVESSHFKQLLLPTRSDSVDEVFVNITTDDFIACPPHKYGATDSYTRTQAMYTKVQGRNSPLSSPKLPTEGNHSNRNSKLQSPISMASSFLFDSKMFQATKENISSAIDNKASGTEEKSSLWDLLFGSAICKEAEEIQSNSLCISNTMQDSYVSNGAVGNVSRPQIKSRRGAFTRTQSLDRDPTVCVIQKTRERELSNGQMIYAARHSPLIGANQPIIGLSPMTAQGQLYRTFCPIPKSPLARNPEGTSLMNCASSHECLSAIPLESQSKDDISNKSAKKYDGSEAFAKCKPKNSMKEVTKKCVISNFSFDNSTQNMSENGEIVDSADLESHSQVIISRQEIQKGPPQKCETGIESRKGSSISQTTDEPSQHFRYYHVFREGELVDLIEKHVENLHIIHTYYDHANWCVVAEKVEVWRI